VTSVLLLSNVKYSVCPEKMKHEDIEDVEKKLFHWMRVINFQMFNIINF